MSELRGSATLLDAVASADTHRSPAGVWHQVTHDLSARIPRERGNPFYRGRTCVSGKVRTTLKPRWWHVRRRRSETGAPPVMKRRRLERSAHLHRGERVSASPPDRCLSEPLLSTACRWPRGSPHARSGARVADAAGTPSRGNAGGRPAVSWAISIRRSRGSTRRTTSGLTGCCI